MDREKAENAVRELLLALDQDLTDVNMIDTPKLVADMFIQQLTPEDAELDKLFIENYEDLVMVRDIPIVGFCSHHLLPYYGRAHITYIPHKRVLGISKLARLVYSCAKGFTLQEAVTRNVADTLYDSIDAKGVMVVIEAVHSCMDLRGARSIGASVMTSAVRGIFRDVPAARSEFLSLVSKGGPR